MDFSFSGLKTAVRLAVLKLGDGRTERQTELLCRDFQDTVVRILTGRARRALEHTRYERLVVAGGVAVNSALREGFHALAQLDGIKLHLAAPELCTDNAAMIAAIGHEYLVRGMHSELDLNPHSTSRKAVGKRGRKR